MKPYRRKMAGLIFTVMIAVFAMMLSGCKRSDDRDGQEYFLYYVDKSYTKLVSDSYYSKEENTSKLVGELLSAMNNTSSRINSLTAIPSSVKMNYWKLEDKVLYVDFDNGYTEMGKVEEILCRSAVVLTVTQAEGVDYVNFTVKDTPLPDSSGKPVGNMKATDFVDNSGSALNSYESREAVLYFADSTGEALVEEVVSSLYSSNVSMERFIIEQLQKGPTKEGHKRTIPASVKLNSVSTKDGICYVNFDGAFLSEIIDVSGEVEIYSLVNSLCELSYIQKVQISVNGETDKKFRDKIPLDSFFIRNLDIVIMTPEETSE